MSKRWIGYAVALAVSVIIGIVAGEMYFRFIFHRTVPENALTDYYRSAARVGFWLGGFPLGLAMFGWGFAMPLVIRALTPRDRPDAASGK